MWVEILKATLGLAATLLLGTLYWQKRSDLSNSMSPERGLISNITYLLSGQTVIKVMVVVTVLLGISGFLPIPLGYHGLRDSLVLLHTIGGGLLVLVLVAFIIPRAAGLGWIDRQHRPAAPDLGEPQDGRTVIAFWGIVVLGLVLVGTILAVLSAGVSQSEQDALINLHSLAAFLFILSLGMFARQVTKRG
jgi:hypothetical protein